MVQAAVLDGLVFDAPPFCQDGFASTKGDVGWGEVADAFVVTMVVVVVDEGGDGGFESAFEEAVCQKDAVLEGLAPAFRCPAAVCIETARGDFTLGQVVQGRTEDVLHAFVPEVFGQILGDVGRAIIAEKPRLVQNFGAAAAGRGQDEVERVGHIFSPHVFADLGQ